MGKIRCFGQIHGWWMVFYVVDLEGFLSYLEIVLCMLHICAC